MHEFRVQTGRRSELVDVTDRVVRVVAEHGGDSGAVLVYVPHTTAGVMINEAADPDVAGDIEACLDKLVPRSQAFRHGEGNSDAHIKATLVGESVTVPVKDGQMALGTWQGIFFAEFDGPRTRRVVVRFLR